MEVPQTESGGKDGEISLPFGTGGRVGTEVMKRCTPYGTIF